MFQAYPASYRRRILRIDHGFEDTNDQIGRRSAAATWTSRRFCRFLRLRRAPACRQNISTPSIAVLDRLRKPSARRPSITIPVSLEAYPRGSSGSPIACISFLVGASRQTKQNRLSWRLSIVFVFPSGAEDFGLAPPSKRRRRASPVLSPNGFDLPSTEVRASPTAIPVRCSRREEPAAFRGGRSPPCSTIPRSPPGYGDRRRLKTALSPSLE